MAVNTNSERRDMKSEGMTSAESSHTALASSLRGLLESVRGEIRRHIALDGLLIALIWTAVIFWLGAAIDYLPVRVGSTETPYWLRASLLVAIGFGIAWALVWRLLRRLFVRLPDKNLAVLIERRYPQLNSELVTAVELVQQPIPDVSRPAAYRAMLERVHLSAASHVETVQPGQLLNWRPIYALTMVASCLMFLTVVIALMSPGWMKLWSQRLFMLSEERWPRQSLLRADGVQIQLPTFTGQLSAERKLIPFVDKKARVPRGGAVILQISADTKARQTPELCTLFYSTEDGSRGRANLRRLGSSTARWQEFMLDGPPLYGLTGNLDFDVVGGDARLDDFRLEAVEPAIITSMKLDIEYPSYLLALSDNRAPREQIEYRSGVRVPEGAKVTLLGEASGELDEVQFVIRTTQSKSSSNKATVDSELNTGIQILSTKPIGKAFSIPLGVVQESAVVEIRTTDRNGLCAEQIPRYLLGVAEDVAPEVSTKLVGIGTAVTPRALIPIRGTITDDHALARIWTTLVVNEQPPLEIDGTVNRDGDLEANIDLAKLAEASGISLPTDATLGMAVSASDHYNLNGRNHVGSGQPIQLAIVSDDKLLNMLNLQEVELRQRLEQTISELRQLRDAVYEQSQTWSDSSTSRQNTTLRIPARQSGALSASLSLTRFAFPTALLASSSTSSQQPPEDEPNNANTDPEQARRLALLRAQQSVLQADKSQQELVGISQRVEDIRLQLINNRVDSIDRQVRLQEKVHAPLQIALTNEMEQLRRKLNQMQTAVASPAGARTQALAAVEANDQLLVALEAIVSNLLDLESFSEIVDKVREILETQERLLQETQKEQKQLQLKQLQF